MGKIVAGERFTKLLVQSFSHRKESNAMAYYNCVCDCGNTLVVAHGNLQSGHTKSCGCLRIEKAYERRTHGFTTFENTHKTYKAWTKIKDRCNNENCADYYNYGAKGVSVHQSFLDDFMNFYNEVGEAPNDGQNWSIDRIDHTRNYEPGNLRWATDAQQARNKGKMKNNTSGTTGVSWENKLHPNGMTSTTYAVVQWKEDFKFKKKLFSVKTYGLLPAFALAVQHRKDQIKRLNELGYGYSDNHGE